MNLMDTIHLHKNDFSKTERKVYDYIIQNPSAVETATIPKIAELCQVSTSGILRFCRVLGLQDLGINTYFAYDYMQANHLYNTIHEDDLLIYFSIEGNQNNVSRFFDLSNASENTYLITLNSKPKLAIENTLILPGYTLSKQSIVDLQSIVVIFVELLLNMLHNTLK